MARRSCWCCTKRSKRQKNGTWSTKQTKMHLLLSERPKTTEIERKSSWKPNGAPGRDLGTIFTSSNKQSPLLHQGSRENDRPGRYRTKSRMATLFCGYCRTNWHTPEWSGVERKWETKRWKMSRLNKTFKERITFTNYNNKRTGHGHGSRVQSRLLTSDTQTHVAMAHQLALDGAMQSNPTWNEYNSPRNRRFNPECRPTRTRLSICNFRFPQGGRWFSPNILYTHRSVAPGLQRPRSPIIPNRDQSSCFNHNLQPIPPRNNSVFQRPQKRNERPNTLTRAKQGTFPKTINMGGSSTVQFPESDYSVNIFTNFGPLNYHGLQKSETAALPSKI